MIISEQGFTERLSSQASRINSTSGAGQGNAVTSREQGDSSDLLQLSSIASRLQSTNSEESAASRASRVSQLAQVVGAGTYRIDSATISSALISESVQSAHR